MLDKIKEISDSVSEKISRITSLNELGDLRVRYLGKNGEITASHVSLVSDFVLEDEDSMMSDAQKSELKKIYLDIIEKTAD